jgi:cytochrome d ubiquinol oxidase subunit I
MFIIAVCMTYNNRLEKHRWMLRLMVWSIPLVYLCSHCGWIVAELGRQPWAIQDIMPAKSAVSRLDVGAVQLTFFLFLVLFAILLTAELRIMLKQIKKGPNFES